MKFWTVDAFSNEIFHGNPAGVCIVEKFPEEDLMQKIAAEINLSETAFVVPKKHGHYDIRWFTPTTEVNLCGHATLASAHVLWNDQGCAKEFEKIYFDSHSGVLAAQKNKNSITLDFPAYTSELMGMPDGLGEALGISPIAVSKALDDLIVELHSVKAVKKLTPDISKLKEINCRGIIVTASGEPEDEYDFVSRFFAPSVGVNEDPVTGSAHCKLAPYWAERLNKTEFLAYQASKRGGVINVRYEHERTYLTGQAVTAFMGKFLNI